MQKLFHRFIYNRPAVLLVLVNIMWSGNTVAGRLAVGEMSPMVITCFRWLITSSLLMILFGRQVVSEWPKVAGRWPYFLLMGLCGFTAFNAIFYYVARFTSGINMSIIQAAIPVFVLIGTFVWKKKPVYGVQIVGLVLSIVGIAIVATKGEMGAMAAITFNIGDLMMLFACVFSAFYVLALSDRPPLAGMSFFIFLSAGAFVTSLPMIATEYALGAMQMPTPKGWIILLYIALLPSLVAQIFFIRGVELIGASRAGIFQNLTPILGSLMAVAFLGESFGLYHALSLLLVLGGIFVAERRRI